MRSSATPVRFPLSAISSLRGTALLLPLGAGVVAGTCLFVWTHLFLATFGQSLPVTAGLTVALAAGVALGWRLLDHEPSDLPARRFAEPAGWATIALWTLALPRLLTLATWFVGLIPVSWLELEATAFLLLLVVGVCTMSVPVAALTWIGSPTSWRDTHRDAATFSLSTRFLLGGGLSMGAMPLLGASWINVDHLGHLLSALATVACWITAVGASDQVVTMSHTSSGRKARLTPDRRTLMRIVGVAMLSGAALSVVGRIIMQFMPGSAYEHYAFWSGLLCGVAVGRAWGRLASRSRERTFSRDGVLTACVIVAAWPIVLLLLSPVLRHWTLSLNAGVDNVPLLLMVRWSFCCFACLPVGAAVGRLASPADDERPPHSMVGATTALVGTAAGWVLMSSLPVSASISCAIVPLGAVTLLVQRLRTTGPVTLHRRHWAGGVVVMLLLASLPMALNSHRPDLSARLLFSAQTFNAQQSGFPRELLSHIDDGRLVTVGEGREATWTVWKHRGSQLHFRRDGIPVGIVSTDPAACPQFAGDVLPAVIPLVVHPNPDRVLVAGLGSSATLSTCLACPVRHITCLEGDDELIRIHDGVVSAATGFNPLDDDRVHLRNIDPPLAFLASGDRYDVVILGDAHPSLMCEESQFTREFYESITGHLRPGGVVCQRLQYADFGRKPVESILATLQSVFPQVVCLESAPGEMVLLAANNTEPLFDESLFDRCEADHIRRLLAQVGWDWSVLLNLAAISPEQVKESAAGDVRINTTSNGLFAYRLPQEVMRWGPKWREVQALITERGSRMLAWVGESSQVPEVTQRLADMTEQQRLIIEHPDRWNAYRAALKERLQERPRQTIRPVNHELKRTLHPEDERRKEYLELLGDVATTSTPQTTDIEQMTDFIEPYDPLVSYFLHQEAARLYDRSAEADHLAQLNHLRHSVYFGPTQDRSVRNVIAALELLLNEPDLIPDPQQRWDEMNALLDTLRQRSALRVQLDRTASSFELLDAEQSISVAERAMQAMSELHQEIEIPTEDWGHRRSVLERLLVRPMWTYHAKQAERLAAIEAQLEQTAEHESEDGKPTLR